MSDPTWISTEHHSTHSDLNPATNLERMLSPQNTHKEDDGKNCDSSHSYVFLHSSVLFFLLFSFLSLSVWGFSLSLYPSLNKTTSCHYYGKVNINSLNALLFPVHEETHRRVVSIRAKVCWKQNNFYEAIHCTFSAGSGQTENSVKRRRVSWSGKISQTVLLGGVQVEGGWCPWRVRKSAPL